MSEPFWEPLAAAAQPPATSGVWKPGDTKVSAQPATHADPTGGTWYLADGSAIPAGETALIALIGASLPDAKGRALIMKGTHPTVDTVGDHEGQPTVSERQPFHKHTLTLNDPGHGHDYADFYGTGSTVIYPSGSTPVLSEWADIGRTTSGKYTGITGSVGPASSTMLDGFAFVVPGNLFYHS